MSAKRYVVKLTKRERGDLVALIRRGRRKVSAIKRRHARVLLKVDRSEQRSPGLDGTPNRLHQGHRLAVPNR